jgi:hypothetical protein
MQPESVSSDSSLMRRQYSWILGLIPRRSFSTVVAPGPGRALASERSGPVVLKPARCPPPALPFPLPRAEFRVGIEALVFKLHCGMPVIPPSTRCTADAPVPGWQRASESESSQISAHCGMQAWLVTHFATSAAAPATTNQKCAWRHILRLIGHRSPYTGTGQDRRPMERGCVF